MQVGMFGERLQDPILGSRSSAYRLGQIRSALTQLRKSDTCAFAACTFTHGRVGGFYISWLWELLDRTVSCGSNNSPPCLENPKGGIGWVKKEALSRRGHFGSSITSLQSLGD